MMLKYNIEVKKDTILCELKKLTNQIYKLLPLREEGSDWQAPLTTIIEEFGGMNELLKPNEIQLFPLQCKLEGLLLLTQEDDFFLYRRTIFECLRLVNEVRENVWTK